MSESSTFTITSKHIANDPIIDELELGQAAVVIDKTEDPYQAALKLCTYLRLEDPINPRDRAKLRAIQLWNHAKNRKNQNDKSLCYKIIVEEAKVDLASWEAAGELIEVLFNEKEDVPPELLEFVIGVLRGTFTMPKKVLTSDTDIRNIALGWMVSQISDLFKMHPTRNDEPNIINECACGLVAKAYKEVTKKTLSFDTVKDAYYKAARMGVPKEKEWDTPHLFHNPLREGNKVTFT